MLLFSYYPLVMLVIHVLQVSEAALFVVLRFDPCIKTENDHPMALL